MSQGSLFADVGTISLDTEVSRDLERARAYIHSEDPKERFEVFRLLTRRPSPGPMVYDCCAGHVGDLVPWLVELVLTRYPGSVEFARRFLEELGGEELRRRIESAYRTTPRWAIGVNRLPEPWLLVWQHPDVETRLCWGYAKTLDVRGVKEVQIALPRLVEALTGVMEEIYRKGWHPSGLQDWWWRQRQDGP